MRLPIDRVFTIEGAGCVVTGTLWSGVARIGDVVELLPSAKEARIRGIQVHGVACKTARAGQRVALNLAGIAATTIARGDTVVTPRTTVMTGRFDVWLTYLGSDEGKAMLKSGARVHVHHGATTTLGRVLLFDQTSLEPSSSTFAQIHLQSPIAARYNDRFILRSYSPTYTIGGGVILMVQTTKRPVLHERERTVLSALREGDIREALRALMDLSNMPHTSVDLALRMGVVRSEVAAALNESDFVRIKGGRETAFITQKGAQRIRDALDETLRAYHETNAQATDMSTATLREQATPYLTTQLFDIFIQSLVQEGVVTLAAGRVHHNHVERSAQIQQQELVEKVLPWIKEQGLSPGSLGDLSSRFTVDTNILRSALAPYVTDNTLLRLGGDRYFSTQAIEHGARSIGGYLADHPEGATAAQLRDVLGISRKYAIPLLEYCDANAITKRIGDLRFLGRTKT
jgi:selenocysteine-specific elongation factor